MTTTETEFKPWDEMTPEEQQAYMKRIEVERYQRDYSTYSAIIDSIQARYDTGLSTMELTELVSSWIYDQREIVADEKEEELKGEPDQTAEAIEGDVGNGWSERDEEDEDDDEE